MYGFPECPGAGTLTSSGNDQNVLAGNLLVGKGVWDGAACAVGPKTEPSTNARTPALQQNLPENDL